MLLVPWLGCDSHAGRHARALSKDTSQTILSFTLPISLSLSGLSLPFLILIIVKPA